MSFRDAVSLIILSCLLLTGCGKERQPTVLKMHLPDHGEVIFLKKDNLSIELYDEQDQTFSPVLFSIEQRQQLIKNEEPIPTLETFGLDAATSQPIVFIVSPPRWESAPLKPDKPEEMEDVLFTIRERLYRYLLRAYPHPVRVRYAWSRRDERLQDYRVLRVESRVSYWDGGWNLGRYLIGFGLGAATIRIEGEIYEGHTGGELLARFRTEASHGAYAQNGLNTQVLKDSYALKYACEEAIGRLARHLPLLIPGVQTHPDFRGGTEDYVTMINSENQIE